MKSSTCMLLLYTTHYVPSVAFISYCYNSILYVRERMLCFKIIILNFIFCKELFKNFIIQTVAKVIYVKVILVILIILFKKIITCIELFEVFVWFKTDALVPENFVMCKQSLRTIQCICLFWENWKTIRKTS